jgi:cytochrome c oxidase assembly protein subunit 15
VAVGGVVRITASGLGCPHWPLCTANAIPLDQKASFIEYSHRAVVTLLIVLVIAVQRNRNQRRDEGADDAAGGREGVQAP